MSKAEFIPYVFDFYGPGKLYPMGASKEQIAAATEILIKRGDDVAFDSIDREKVRDILLGQFGLKWPEV